MKDAVLGALAVALVFYLAAGAFVTFTWVVLDMLDLLNPVVPCYWRIAVPLFYVSSCVVTAVAVRPWRPSP